MRPLVDPDYTFQHCLVIKLWCIVGFSLDSLGSTQVSGFQLHPCSPWHCHSSCHSPLYSRSSDPCFQDES
eukprot:scaffold26085_cov113-Cylindrotheca_fusiformis.AAC.1